VEHDWPCQDELGAEDEGRAKLQGSHIIQEHGEVAWQQESSQPHPSEHARLSQACAPVGDGEHAGQLELVDGQVGGDRSVQGLVLGPELLSCQVL